MINTDYQLWLVASINQIIIEMGGEPIPLNQYQTLQDFMQAALPYIQANAGTGGGTVIWFTDITTRDAYYVANPGKLKEGISCGVGDPVTCYTYDGTNWITGALAFRGPQGEPVRLPIFP